MQLNREELIKAYQGMCRIREFEDAVHEDSVSSDIDYDYYYNDDNDNRIINYNLL